MVDQKQAEEFFRQLDIFSKRYCKSLGLASNISPWGGYVRDGFDGAILHFTADPSLENVVRWFVDPECNSKVSAHVVVADHKLGTHEIDAKDLPLVVDLPATVILCRPPTETAWHATWTNRTHFGVECINAGELRTQDEIKFTWWPAKNENSPTWTKPWAVPYKAAVHQAKRWWDPYPVDQLSAVVATLRYLRAMFPDSLRPVDVLGHEQVQSVDTLRENGARMATDKRDPGPSFPLHEIRKAVFDDWKPLGQYPWFKPYQTDPTWGDTERTWTVISAAKAIGGSTLPLDPKLAWERFCTALVAFTEDPNVAFGPWGKLGLYLLGYYMPSVERGQYTIPEIGPDERISVMVFQRMMGLKPDGDPGPLTRAALCKRLKDRGIL